MTEYIRRIVSGNKARFKDDNLNLELDLVYVTDQVVIMGYPASGMEGLYRNRREDAIRFLEHRHGKNYWVFNFCPLKENSYEADIFEGRVSRYPFPDHHAPPLAIMPLVAREMNDWLNGSPERVAVLHCKAGKGRSGTMACAYLLSLDDTPTPPQLERSHTAKEWAKKRTANTIAALPADTDSALPSHHPLSPLPEKTVPSDTDGILDVDTGAASPRMSTPNREKSFTDALKGVLDLHTARRMKSPSPSDGKAPQKVKQGVSIPSQRRFLTYWSLLLAHSAPAHMWVAPPNTGAPRPKVRLTQLRLRMRETSGMKMGLVRAANKVIERTSIAKTPGGGDSAGAVWASLARYDDCLVDLLEDWELHTRDSGGNMGERRHASDHRTAGENEEAVSEIFKSGKWDKGKMVRSFARLGGEKKECVDDKGEKIDVYILKPLSDKRWEGLKHDIHKGAPDTSAHQETLEVIAQQAEAIGVSQSEANSMHDLTSASVVDKDADGRVIGVNLDQGVIVDAGREVRVKLYIGQVFIGWLWFIPTFHMPQGPPSSPAPSSAYLATPSHKATFTLTRKEIDFPIGLGSGIIDIEIDMEWVPPASGRAATLSAGSSPLTDLEPPVRVRTEDSKIGAEVEPRQTGISAVVQAIVGGGKEGGMEGMEEIGFRETVEAKQGVE